MTFQEHRNGCSQCFNVNFDIQGWADKLCNAGSRLYANEIVVYRDEKLRFNDAFITDPLAPLIIEGMLSINWHTGVISFTSKAGVLNLVVCGLPCLESRPNDKVKIDISHMKGVVIHAK